MGFVAAWDTRFLGGEPELGIKKFELNANLGLVKKQVDPAECRDAVLAIAAWVKDPGGQPKPPRAQIAAAVRLTVRTLVDIAPGQSVEVRVPPFVAVQCVAGPIHTRGTPPNVVEASPLEWLRLATGLASLEEADIAVSGSRAAEIKGFLPVVRLA